MFFFNLKYKLKMEDEKFKNYFLGTSFKNENFYIDMIDLNNNIDTKLIHDFNSEKENKIKIDDKYTSFCYDCNKNISKDICDGHNVQNFKDIIDKIDIKEIENNFKRIIENYNYIINKIESKLKELKRRNEEQINLVIKMIEIYNSSLYSKNFTYQLLLNIKNILNFNEINDDLEINQNIFEYNILKLFPIDNYIKESISIKKFQKIFKLEVDYEINSILLLEKKNKFIIWGDSSLQLLNTKTFKLEYEFETKNEILSLNLMKDNETLLSAHKYEIKKINILNNELKIENYLQNIYISPRVKIINYKDGIAWASKSSIFLFYNNKTRNVILDKDKILGFFQEINILTLFEYDDDILLYLYYLKEKKVIGDEPLHFNYLKKGKNNHIYKDIIMDKFYNISSMNSYKINKFGNNKVIIFAGNEIDIINMLTMQKIKTIILEKNYFEIYNSYCLNDSYILLCILNDSKNGGKNNMIIYKIKDNFSQIVLEAQTENGADDDLYFYSITNNLNNCKLISIDSNKIYFQEISFNIEKTSNFIIDYTHADFKEENCEKEKNFFLWEQFEDEEEEESEN